MLELALLVGSIGLADSVNPSTIAPALALALHDHGARRVATFIAGVFAVSLLAGVLVVVGLGSAFVGLIPHPGARVKRAVELGAGVLLLALAGAAWAGRRRLEARLAGAGARGNSARGGGAAFGFGAGIMIVELPTAVPYFAAIAAIIGSGESVARQLLLLVVFNVAFVLPLVAILVVRRAAGDQASERLGALRTWLARHAGAVLAILLATGGCALIALAAGAAS